MDAVERPSVEQMEFQVLTEEQVRQFLITAIGSPFETLYYLAITTGMRKGELLGLKWSDLNEEKRILFVERQLQHIPGKGDFLVSPKTKKGRRVIKLGPRTLGKLQAHRAEQELLRAEAGIQWQENSMIFTSTIGTFLDQSKVSKEFKKVLRRAGLPNIRFHDLRHTSITSLLESGTSVNMVQNRAGHAMASTTMNIYDHSLAHSQEEAA